MLRSISILGAGGVGKSSIAIRAVINEFPEDYDPTIEATYQCSIDVDGRIEQIEMLDTAGQEEYVSLQDRWINNTNAFMLVYSVNSQPSFDHIQEYYESIINAKNNERIDLILIANKSDLPSSEHQVTSIMGRELALKWNIPFLEISAKTGNNITEAFQTLVRNIKQPDTMQQDTNDSNECESIAKCSSLRKIRAILHFYQMIAIDNDKYDQKEIQKLLMQCMSSNMYKTNLIDDYHHVLLNHLNENKNCDNGWNYECINDILCRNIKCDINNCKCFIRNSRDREQYNAVNNEINNDKNAYFLTELLDNIHTFFIHGFDTGFRMNTESINKGLKQIEKKNVDNDEKKEDDNIFTDNEVTIRYAYVTKHREKLRKIRGRELERITKFSTDLNDKFTDEQLEFDVILETMSKSKNVEIDFVERFNRFVIEEEFDSDCIRLDVAENEHNSNIYNEFYENNSNNEWFKILSKEEATETDKKEDMIYSFGYRFYYWNWYKNNESDDILYNPGKIYNDLYIDKKYDSLKEEILHILKIEQYETTKDKASELIKESSTFKKMNSCNKIYNFGENRTDGIKDGDYLHYDIPNGTVITAQNLMSVIFYTDYSNLSYRLSASFRKNNKYETLKSLKNRNSMFWNWSKILMETVHLFGNKYNGWSPQPQIKVLYHGISYMYFNSFVSRFCSPTSMTRQLSVALYFSNKNGIILETCQYEALRCSPFYFNCSLLSCYGGEDERLFIGGAGWTTFPNYDYPDGGLLRIKSITLVESQSNFYWFLHALSLLNVVITAEIPMRDDFGAPYPVEYAFHKPESFYCKLIGGLLKGIDSIEKKKNTYSSSKINKYPEYVLKCLQKYVNRTKLVKISFDNMMRFYPKLSEKIFKFSQTCPNLLLFDNICNIFPECTFIEYSPEFTSDVQEIISKTFMEELILMLDNIDNNGMKLKRIKLCLIRDTNVNFHVFVSLFNKKKNWKWCVKQEKNHLLDDTQDTFVSGYDQDARYCDIVIFCK